MEEILYGNETAHAIENFDLGYKKTNLGLIYAMVKIKKAAALTYKKIDVCHSEVFEAIAASCDLVLAGKADDQFVVDALQGGAGTSTHMNVNEVLANLANQLISKKIGADAACVHPLDDVNRGQSTNDVFSTALRIAAIERLRILSGACAKLQEALSRERERL